jgi:Cu2+-exporting ATPase
MIIKLIILTGILGVGYKNFQQQRKKYTESLLTKQRKHTQRLKKSSAYSTESPLTQSFGPTRRMARTPKDLAALSVAVLSSSVGYMIYHPLSYIAPPLALYAERKKIVFATKQLKKGKIEVETLVSASIIGSILAHRFFIGSLLSLTGGIGDYLSSRAIKDNQNQLVDFFQNMPESVWMLSADNTEISVPLNQVKAGDILIVSAGEVIPADGEIIWGTAGIDEHHFTGESIPAEKSIGDSVYAMTLVLSGKINFKINKAGMDTSARQIIDILNSTADYKSSTVLEAEALSRQMVQPAMLVGGLTLPLLGLSPALAVLIAHPKERLQISAPLSLMVYLKQALQEGMLIKDGRSLELLHKVDTIVFDKTGTLTEDKPHIGAIHSFVGCDENEILRYTVIAEHKQTHPIAQAIFSEAAKRHIDIDEPEQSECCLGYGIKVVFQKKSIHVGSLRFLQSEGIAVPGLAQKLQQDCRLSGHGLVMVGLDGQLIGALELLPTIRPEAKEAVLALKQLGQIKKTYIISGDHKAPTRKLANELGIDNYFAQTLPEQKAELIEKLQQEGHFVCFIGDGINDAIAMKQAQVSISLSGASQLATDTAQIILLDAGITHLPRLFDLANYFDTHMQRQLKIVLGPSIFGVSMVLMAGWGMSALITLSITSIVTTLGYALMDRPQKKLEQDRHKIVRK